VTACCGVLIQNDMGMPPRVLLRYYYENCQGEGLSD
jgi:hypothetical protein